MNRWITGFAAAALLLGGVGQARASIVQLFSSASLDPADVTAIYPDTDGTREPSGVTASAGGNTLTFSDMPAVGFLRADQGNTWTGGFPDGTKLLWGIDSTGSFYGGPVTIAFATGVTEAGLTVQSDLPDTTTFTFTAFNGGSSFGPFTATSDAAGDPVFLGAKASGADVITSLVISSSDASPANAANANDFAFGPVTFSSNAASVPEPSTLAIAGVCAAGLFVYGRRRRAAASRVVVI